MFEVGWTEMLVIAIVMIVVVGPKDLPAMLRTFGRTTAKLRAMAGDFQKQFNEALKEAELDDVKKSIDSLRSLNPAAEIRKQLNPFEKAAADVRSGLDNVMKPKPASDPAKPAAPDAEPAEPLKNGATQMPGVDGPDTMPAPPVFPAMTEKSVVAEATPGGVASPKTPAKVPAAKATPARKSAAKAAPAGSAAVKKIPPTKTAASPAPAASKALPSAKAAKAKAAPKSTAAAKPAPAVARQASPPAKKSTAAKPAAASKTAPAGAKKPIAVKKKTAGT